ncbi:ATP-binding protein [Amycolatopsis sp. OK19-0408]|uniref:ATP-binding protein n=1 Tax=Amycolatopsis iheyensis TaxID=2945988 RepID=A0A9X2SRU9_9PSEU|nr:ATP-binding protein [Amycolatopsis iheyensis]MCR6490780.1 ATP-binding protein [Amycolatopsis iheyensis]
MRTIATRELGGGSGRMADIRSWAQDLLGDVDGETRADAVLVLDELVSNALHHGAAPARVRLVREPGCLRIEVTDGSRRPARPRTPDRTGGRGLVLVEACARGWGQWWHGDGKTVWAELPVTAAAG